MNRSLRHLVAVTTAALTAMCAVPTVADTGGSANAFGKINHIVVIYEENHSFDNLYGGWEGVNGRANADPSHTLQIGQGDLTRRKQEGRALRSPALLLLRN